MAARLDAGDPAGAKQEAGELERDVETAIAAGRVPRAFRADLRQAVAGLVASVEAAQPAPPPVDDEGGDQKGQKHRHERHGHGEGNRNGQGEGNGQGEDD